ARQKLGRGIPPCKRRLIVEIGVVERRQHTAQRLAGAPDVDDQTVRIEIWTSKLDIDHVGRAVQPLCGAKDGTAKTVGNHHVVTNAECVHRNLVSTLVNKSANREDTAHKNPPTGAPRLPSNCVETVISCRQAFSAQCSPCYSFLSVANTVAQGVAGA